MNWETATSIAESYDQLAHSRKEFSKEAHVMSAKMGMWYVSTQDGEFHSRTEWNAYLESAIQAGKLSESDRFYCVR